MRNNMQHIFLAVILLNCYEQVHIIRQMAALRAITTAAISSLQIYSENISHITSYFMYS